MNGKRTYNLTEKLALHMGANNASPRNITTHFNYNGLNEIRNST